MRHRRGRAVGGVGGVMAECSDCIVHSLQSDVMSLCRRAPGGSAGCRRNAAGTGSAGVWVPRAGGFLVYPRVRGGEGRDASGGGVMKCERYAGRRAVDPGGGGGYSRRKRWLVGVVVYRG